ncbi:hypothetical protein [Suttonella ornithocola]|nr:hypothetical protein [Suttonella ornithocola]
MATKALILLSPMLFTRPNELREMRWDEINGDLGKRSSYSAII